MSAAADDRLHGAFPNSPSATPTCDRAATAPAAAAGIFTSVRVFCLWALTSLSYSVRPSSPTRAAARGGTWHAR